jgi:hypothetical protein
MIMSRTPNYYRQIIQVLEDLNKSHPSYNIGRHLATALDGHNLWGVSDKEVLQALKDYRTELEMDVLHKEDDIEDIIKQGMHLNDILEED